MRPATAKMLGTLELEENHRSFKRDNYLLTMIFISHSTILMRKEYLAKINNLPNPHGAGHWRN